MSKDLFGTVVVDRQMADDDLWLCESFSRGQAWMDLLLLANDRPRLLKVRGVDVQLKTGQVGRSVVALAERWHWSREKTRSFLEQLQDARKITYRMDNVATVITVIDYEVFNGAARTEPGAEPTADRTAESLTEPGAEPTQNCRTVELGKENSGTGEGAREVLAVLPTEAEVRDWASLSGVDPDYAAAKWADTNEKHRWLDRGQLVDWRKRWLRFWTADREGWFAKKNSAARAGLAYGGNRSGRVEGGPPAPVAKPALSLAAMRGGPPGPAVGKAAVGAN